MCIYIYIESMNYIPIIYPTFPKKHAVFFTLISGTRPPHQILRMICGHLLQGFFLWQLYLIYIKYVYIYCIYTYIYIYVYMCMCMYIYVHIYIYIYMYIYIYSYIFTYIYDHLCIYLTALFVQSGQSNTISDHVWSKSCIKPCIRNTASTCPWCVLQNVCIKKSLFVQNKQRLLNMALYLSIIRTFSMIINVHDHGMLMDDTLDETTYHSGKTTT